MCQTDDKFVVNYTTRPSSKLRSSTLTGSDTWRSAIVRMLVKSLLALWSKAIFHRRLCDRHDRMKQQSMSLAVWCLLANTL